MAAGLDRDNPLICYGVTFFNYFINSEIEGYLLRHKQESSVIAGCILECALYLIAEAVLQFNSRPPLELCKLKFSFLLTFLPC